MIDSCVNALSAPVSFEDDEISKDAEADFLNGVLSAFSGMMKEDAFTSFLGDHSGEEKGFAGFANFLNNQLKGVEKLEVKKFESNKEALDEALGKMKIKVLPVLARVGKYSGVGSRVKPFVAPCKRLYREIINIGTGQTDRGFGSYFDEACELLRSAANSEYASKFYEFMNNAYDAVSNMCKYEKVGTKNKDGKEENTASRNWYFEYVKNKGELKVGKINAVLGICEYKSDRGRMKQIFKLRGQTKWQKLCKFAEKAKKNGVKIEALNNEGKYVPESSSLYTQSPDTSNPVQVQYVNDGKNENKESTTPIDISTTNKKDEKEIDNDDKDESKKNIESSSDPSAANPNYSGGN